MLYDENLLNGEQQKIEDCYKQIGLRYYAYYKDDPAPEFMDLIAAIRESKRVMSEHRAEVLRANGKMICPNCGQQVAITAMFCTSCGLRIRQADAPAPAAAPAGAGKVITSPLPGVIIEVSVKEHLIFRAEPQEFLIESVHRLLCCKIGFSIDLGAP